VFDRYVLVVTPGAVLITAWGWEHWLSSPRSSIRRLAYAGVAACTVLTIISLVRAERRVGEVDVDVLVRRWIMTHVERGRRIAIHDEDNAYLPRAAEQLRQCSAYVETPDASREKWLVEGVKTEDNQMLPMQAILLTDERFRAYWCRRELEVQTDPGYWIVTYNEQKRFGAVLERDAISEFRNDQQTATGGIDVLVTNRPVDAGRPPAQVFRTERGARVIYTR
jgi:hypothetical protein